LSSGLGGNIERAGNQHNAVFSSKFDGSVEGGGDAGNDLDGGTTIL
jgi:hypothetical protein